MKCYHKLKYAISHPDFKMFSRCEKEEQNLSSSNMNMNLKLKSCCKNFRSDTELLKHQTATFSLQTSQELLLYQHYALLIYVQEQRVLHNREKLPTYKIMMLSLCCEVTLWQSEKPVPDLRADQLGGGGWQELDPGRLELSAALLLHAPWQAG